MKFFVGLLLCAAVIGAVFLTHTEEAPPSGNQLQVAAERTYWVHAIERAGSKDAYALFVSSNTVRTPNVQHSASHLMGEALYTALGIEGIGVCDDAFSFGCYHGFFSRVISEYGVESVATLDTECIALGAAERGPCQHGIGHGVLQYFGYDRLNEALDACTLTDRIDQTSGCPSGVFMEFNVPLSENERGESVVLPRPFDIDNPYAPCDTVAESFVASCYYELPQWWAQIFENDYEKLSSLCAGLSDQKFSELCFLKIGNLVVSNSTTDTSEIEMVCTSMATQAGTARCLFGAAETLSWDAKTAEEAHDVCGMLITAYPEETCEF